VGELLGDQNYNDFLKMARTGNFRMLEPPFLQQIPPLDPIFYRDRDRWYSGFENRVKAAAANPTAVNSLLQQALKAGPTVLAKDLAEWLSAPIFFGGVFSVAGGIAHTLRFLAGEPEYLAAVLVELRTNPDSEKLDHALCESLRLSPPVSVYFRNVSRTSPRRSAATSCLRTRSSSLRIGSCTAIRGTGPSPSASSRIAGPTAASTATCPAAATSSRSAAAPALASARIRIRPDEDRAGDAAHAHKDVLRPGGGMESAFFFACSTRRS